MICCCGPSAHLLIPAPIFLVLNIQQSIKPVTGVHAVATTGGELQHINQLAQKANGAIPPDAIVKQSADDLSMDSLKALFALSVYDMAFSHMPTVIGQ